MDPVKQIKIKKAMRDDLVSVERLPKRCTLTKQNNPRPAKNDPSTHDETVKSAKKRKAKSKRAIPPASDPNNTFGY